MFAIPSFTCAYSVFPVLSFSVIPFILNIAFPPVTLFPFSSFMFAVIFVMLPMLDFIGWIVIVVFSGGLVSSFIVLFSVSIVCCVSSSFSVGFLFCLLVRLFSCLYLFLLWSLLWFVMLCSLLFLGFYVYCIVSWCECVVGYYSTCGVLFHIKSLTWRHWWKNRLYVNTQKEKKKWEFSLW